MDLDSIRSCVGRMFKSAVTEQDYPASLDEKLSPVFIIGSGRSGNTLLRRILTNNPALYIPPETYVLGQVARQFKSSSCLDWQQLCLLTLGTFSNSEDFEMFPSPYLREVYKDLSGLPEEERSLAKIVDGFYQLMRQHAKPSAVRWGDKTPMNSFSLSEIDEMFPSAQYVHMIRNGYDVVNSYLKMGRYSDPLEAAGRWVSAINDCNTFAGNNPKKVVEIRYEDLCRTPESVTEGLCSFLDLEYSADMVQKTEDLDTLGDIAARAHYSNVANAISTLSIGMGVGSLDKATRDQMLPLISETMSSLGYEV